MSTWHVFPVVTALLTGMVEARAEDDDMLIHDFSNQSLTSAFDTEWRAVSDQVMGGISQPELGIRLIDGRHGLHLTGDVRLENDGGFIQASLDLADDGESFDASAFRGIRLLARGNGERYSVHLRTKDVVRPWQSYRASFVAGPQWQTIDLPFDSFTPHRLEALLDIDHIRRLGLVAIGRAFEADLAVAEMHFYR